MTGHFGMWADGHRNPFIHTALVFNKDTGNPISSEFRIVSLYPVFICRYELVLEVLSSRLIDILYNLPIEASYS
jgi:hypothetical protein